MKTVFKLGMLFFAFSASNALAEGNCPPGMYPIGGGNAGWVGCAPMSGGGGGGGGGGQSYSKPGRWLSSYGSLYWGYDKDGVLSYSYAIKKDTLAIAQNAAYNSCVNAGYTGCQNALDFWNNYLAIVYDENGLMWASAHEKESKAKKNALAACKKDKGKNCKVFKTADNRADWVQ